MKIPNYITNHIQYTASDYVYLNSKGYTDKEIKTKWDSEWDATPVYHA